MIVISHSGAHAIALFCFLATPVMTLRYRIPTVCVGEDERNKQL
jgi:hypothetical protein